MLYANAEVSKELREKFVLYWQSVRPVPVVTIDFGDGRKIRRTITGNSIHYVLTADGTVLDGIPGLYGPKAFLRELAEDQQAYSAAVNLSPEEQSQCLKHFHEDAAMKISNDYASDLKRAGFDPTSPLDDAPWTKIASLHAGDATLDQPSVALMAAKNPNAAAAAPRAFSKMIVENPLVRVVQNFQRSIAEDTVRNQYKFHLQIHRWLADPSQAKLVNDVGALNQRVYAELFLTPDTDPWLGLIPTDSYAALDDDGVCR